MNFGGGSSNQDTRFERTGVSANSMSYGLPSFLTDLLTSTAKSAQSDPFLGQLQNNLYHTLLGQQTRSIPGYDQLRDMSQLAPTDFTGAQNLQGMAERNPFTTGYEQATQGAYEQRAADAMAMAGTGQDSVRGGDARTGIAQGVLGERLAQGRGQEVRQAQLQDAGLAQQAAQGYAGIEGARRNDVMGSANALSSMHLNKQGAGLGAAAGLDRQRGVNAGVLQGAADTLGSRFGSTTDNMKGRGAQAQTSFNWGANLLGGCCFIFLQGLNGNLPWYIELARKDYYTPRRKRGYKWMSSWLVPAMRRSGFVKQAINTCLIRPFLRYGAWLYGDPSGTFGWCYAPYCQAWLWIWDVLGRHIQEK